MHLAHTVAADQTSIRALWFVEQAGDRIGRITTSGVITEFPGAGNKPELSTETTEQILSARRLETLRKLGVRAQEGRTVEAACQHAANVLSENPRDISFAAIYLVDAVGARLAQSPMPSLGLRFVL